MLASGLQIASSSSMLCSLSAVDKGGDKGQGLGNVGCAAVMLLRCNIPSSSWLRSVSTASF
jgi:hypothetical protein